MKKRFFFCFGALVILASCGKEYNSNPGNPSIITGNPIANSNGVKAGHFYFKSNGADKGFYNATWMYLGNDTSSNARVVYANNNDANAFEGITLTYMPFEKATLKTYESINGIPTLNITYTQGNAASGNSKVYSSVTGLMPFSKSAIHYIDSTLVRGGFEGTLYRVQSGGYDTADKIVIAEGRFSALKMQ